jgi:hypothetical protein
VAEVEDHEALDWSDDGPDAEEHAAQQKAVPESFESLKKVEDDAHAHEEDNKELAVAPRRQPLHRGSCHFSTEHRKHLREDRERR